MKISTEMVKELRGRCGAGIMECRNVLLEVDGDIARALEILKEKGLLKAEKKAERATTQGLVEAYIHTGGRVGAMVELNCETDFVARTDEFKELAHNLAMQVAALSPRYITEEEVPEGAELWHRRAAPGGGHRAGRRAGLRVPDRQTHRGRALQARCNADVFW